LPKPIEEVVDVIKKIPVPIPKPIPVNPIPVNPIPVTPIPAPIGIMPPIARPPVIDLDDINDVPADAVPIAPPHAKPTDLATQVYRITQGKIRNLKGSEVKTIKAFQAEQGQAKVDGMYGPETAEELITYGFVPEIPWIWPSGVPTAKSKAAWNDMMRDQAEVDPQRADEWLSKLAK
jgi:hypothetical protein